MLGECGRVEDSCTRSFVDDGARRRGGYDGHGGHVSKPQVAEDRVDHDTSRTKVRVVVYQRDVRVHARGHVVDSEAARGHACELTLQAARLPVLPLLQIRPHQFRLDNDGSAHVCVGGRKMGGVGGQEEGGGLREEEGAMPHVGVFRTCVSELIVVLRPRPYQSNRLCVQSDRKGLRGKDHERELQQRLALNRRCRHIHTTRCSAQLCTGAAAMNYH